MRLLVLLALFAAAGCSNLGAFFDTSGKSGRSIQRIQAPRLDRCSAQEDLERRSSCDQARDRAVVYVRKLAVDDQVCLEGNSLIDGITHRCQVRAFVADTSAHSVKLEIREAPPSSPFRPMEDYWFAEEALADLYLKSLGFPAPRPP